MRTIDCQFAALIPDTIDDGAINAPIVLALVSSSCTFAGWNCTPVASGVLVTVNTLRQLPSSAAHPE